MSISSQYHYFDSKEELLMFPIQPEVCQQEMEMREAEIGHLKAMNPEAYLRAFIENQAESVTLLRPAVQAARPGAASPLGPASYAGGHH